MSNDHSEGPADVPIAVGSSCPLNRPPHEPIPPTRRGFLAMATCLLGSAITVLLSVPVVGYVLTPILRKKKNDGEFVPLTRLSELEPGVPRVFPVVQSRTDGWVSYPPEPVGSVWLVRKPDGQEKPVLAFTAECPHLACAIALSDDRRGFFCPCHVSSFKLDGARISGASPRDMDPLDVEQFAAGDPDPMIRVRFQRFRTNTEERIPLA